MSQPTSLEAGTSFGRFVVLRQLELGTYCSAYLAREPDGREVRLQHVPASVAAVLESRRGDDPEYMPDPDYVRRQAGALAGLTHPHLLRVYDGGSLDGDWWLATQVAPAVGLADLMGVALPRRRALGILRAAASALDHLHANDIVLGHFRPYDIRVEDAGTFLDVGLEWIARTVELRNASPGFVPVGNPRYLCPELFQARGPTAASDVYTLGLIAFEALVGREPFPAASPIDEVFRKRAADLEPVGPLELPVPAVAVLRRCLAGDPGQRWPTAGAFVASLERALTHEG